VFVLDDEEVYLLTQDPTKDNCLVQTLGWSTQLLRISHNNLPQMTAQERSYSSARKAFSAHEDPSCITMNGLANPKIGLSISIPFHGSCLKSFMTIVQWSPGVFAEKKTKRKSNK
jgi:hypothetical protein